ncbi:hypothetical protein DFH09DRAFT_1034753 [Mycena vulgaris]|nr:hypothetical protein DFH09DRAFT_1034753 [Mycena vulgaris]
MLQRSVVVEALHDSGERFPRASLPPGTRTNILQELREWSVETNPASTILWLHGSAGAGKSAIAQMFAEDCQAQGRLGASFFFRRGHAKRGSWHGLFATVAYQLARPIPEFMLSLEEAMDRDPICGRPDDCPFSSNGSSSSLHVHIGDSILACRRNRRPG